MHAILPISEKKMLIRLNIAVSATDWMMK